MFQFKPWSNLKRGYGRFIFIMKTIKEEYVPAKVWHLLSCRIVNYFSRALHCPSRLVFSGSRLNFRTLYVEMALIAAKK